MATAASTGNHPPQITDGYAPSRDSTHQPTFETTTHPARDRGDVGNTNAPPPHVRRAVLGPYRLNSFVTGPGPRRALNSCCRIAEELNHPRRWPSAQLPQNTCAVSRNRLTHRGNPRRRR